MSYNPAIPQANHAISQSQAQLLANFTAIDSNSVGFGVDHVQFSAATKQGQHKQITFQDVLAANPDKATPIASLYTKASATSITSDLYYQDGNLAANSRRITGGGITAAAWCQFNGSTAGTNPPTEGYNVTSVQRTGTGQYVLNFTRNFATTTYCIIVTPGANSSVGDTGVRIVSRAVASCSFSVETNNALFDSASVNVVIFGTLA